MIDRLERVPAHVEWRLIFLYLAAVWGGMAVALWTVFS